MKTVDLNCDMGEGFGPWEMGDDAAMLRIVTSASIACGFHAGDPAIMARTLAAARAAGVGAGAHPGFHDLAGFGRRVIRGDSPADIGRQVIYQIGALQALARAEGMTLGHVKVHGALANIANDDIELARALAGAVQTAAPDALLVVMPGLATEKAGAELGLRMAREIYADRAYAENGNLAPRNAPGAVIHDAQAAAERVLSILQTGSLTTTAGTVLPVTADTVCVHGDTPGAVAMAEAIRQVLTGAGYRLRPMKDWVGRD